MTEPMPIDLILSARNYEVECLMILQDGCQDMADYLLELGHEDGSTEHRTTVPFCLRHASLVRLAFRDSGLLEVLGAPPFDALCECGKGIALLGVTTLHGEPVQ